MYFPVRRRRLRKSCRKQSSVLIGPLTLIDAFLSTVPEEVTARTDLDYAMDYTAYLLQDNDASVGEQPEAPKLRGFELIDGFIEKSENESAIRLKPLLPGEDSVAEEAAKDLSSDESKSEEEEG